MIWRQMSDQRELKRTLKRKHARLRAIDQGTIYDIAGRLITFARDIRKAEGEQRVTDATLIFHRVDGSVASYHVGPGGRELQHWMVGTISKRLEPRD